MDAPESLTCAARSARVVLRRSLYAPRAGGRRMKNLALE
jgi:hypothetical protein